MISVIKYPLSIILALSVSLSISNAASKGDAVLIDRIVAVVNKSVVLQSELESEIVSIKKKLKDSMELPPEDQIRTQVLNRELKQKFQQWYSGVKLSPEKNLSFINAA